MRRTAGEIRRLVATPTAVVASDFGIGAKGAGAINLAARMVSGDDPPGGVALLDPLFNDADRVEGVGSFAAPAMSHTGGHEEADPFRGLGGICAESEHRIVEIDAGSRGHLLISPAMIDKYLTAVLRERCEVRIKLVDVLVDSVRPCEVALKVESSPVPAGVLVHDVAELIQEDIGRTGAASKTGPAEFRPGLKAWEHDATRRRCGGGGGCSRPSRPPPEQPLQYE